MNAEQPAVTIIGSGIAGSALAAALANAGVPVLVLERTEQFADHVRGSTCTPGGSPKLCGSGCAARMPGQSDERPMPLGTVRVRPRSQPSPRKGSRWPQWEATVACESFSLR
jgi:choline dehydrogenase-like flavoprotein